MSKLTHSEAGKLGYQKSLPTLLEKQQKRVSDYYHNPSLCIYCGNPLPYEKRHNKFCNQSCSASYNNRVRERKPINTDSSDTKTKEEFCKNCGKVLKRGQTQFCSLTCSASYQQDEYIKKWKAGLVDGMSGEFSLSKRIRRYLLEKANFKCEKCGWGEINPTTGKVPLEIHHIDGDYTNNTEENLQVLCPNCHSLTPTYKAINKIGRQGRKKYYLSSDKEQTT